MYCKKCDFLIFDSEKNYNGLCEECYNPRERKPRGISIINYPSVSEYMKEVNRKE